MYQSRPGYKKYIALGKKSHAWVKTEKGLNAILEGKRTK